MIDQDTIIIHIDSRRDQDYKREMTSLFKSFSGKRAQAPYLEFDSLQSISKSFDEGDASSSKYKADKKEVLENSNVINVFKSIDAEPKTMKKVSSFNKMSQLLHPPHRSASPPISPPDKENISPLTNRTSPDDEKSSHPSKSKSYVIKVNKPVDSRFVSIRSLASTSQDSYSPTHKESYHGPEESRFSSIPPPPKFEEEEKEADGKSLSRIPSSHSLQTQRQLDQQPRRTELKNDLHEVDEDKLEDEEGNYNKEEELEYITTLFSKARHNRYDYVINEIENHHFNTNKTDEYGNTLLHICAQNNHRKLASMILKTVPNTNINAKNLKGLTAVDYCEKYGFDKMYDWLIACGAIPSKDSSKSGSSHSTSNKTIHYR